MAAATTGSPKPPSDREAYQTYLGVAIEQRPSQSITFAAGDAGRPFLMANDAMWEVFEPSLRKRLSEIEDDDTHAERVKAALLELLIVTSRNWSSERRSSAPYVRPSSRPSHPAPTTRAPTR